jgi:hypothetical protein
VFQKTSPLNKNVQTTGITAEKLLLFLILFRLLTLRDQHAVFWWRLEHVIHHLWTQPTVNIDITFQLYTKRACIKPGKSAVMYVYVRGIHVSSFHDFSIRFWSCSGSVVFWCFLSMVTFSGTQFERILTNEGNSVVMQYKWLSWCCRGASGSNYEVLHRL